jgi:hypothetical protein
MKTLTSGIKFVRIAACEGEAPIELSAGTVAIPRSSRYEQDAVIPSAPWRSPSSEEVEILTSQVVPEDYSSAISCISLPDHLLLPFEALRAATARGANDLKLNALLMPPLLDAGMRAITSYVKTELRPKDVPEPIEQLVGGIYVRPPAQSTITTNFDTGKHVGLHVDNWSNLPIESRDKAPNRITINLGCQDRFLLFINIAVQSMYKKVHYLVRNNHHGTAIGRVFMTAFPSYPVVRLRVRPGEAYIAPTESVVHDASTQNMNVWDLTLSLRGRIALAPGN